MKKVLFFSILLLSGACYLSCSEDKPAFNPSSFQAPDSINPSRLIAVFNEESVSGVSVLALGNKKHPEPRRITYFTNGEVVTEPLKALAGGRFVSVDGKSEYIVQENNIRANYHSNSGCPNLDVNLVYTGTSE